VPEAADVLAGWTAAPFSAAELTHEVFTREPVAGPGPGVVLLPEIPGMTPAVMGLANHLVGAGFTVAVPSLFGEPGRAV
jgi:dienelactone hydrolase